MSAVEPLIFLATCQPHLRQCDGPRHSTTLLTVEEKEEFVNEVGSRRAGFIPLTMEHAGGEHAGGSGTAADGNFEVPGELQVGRFVDAAMAPNKALAMIGEVWPDRDEARMIADDIRAAGAGDDDKRQKPWGVSLCTNLKVKPDLSAVLSKRVTHAGITRDPEFGPENTFIHLAATNWPAFYKNFQEKFLDQSSGWYLSPQLRLRMLESLANQQSEAANHLSPPLSATPQPLPPSSQTLTFPMSATATPATAANAAAGAAAAANTTATATTTATHPVGQTAATGAMTAFGVDDATVLPQLHATADSFFSRVAPKDKEGHGEMLYDAESLVLAKRLLDQYGQTMGTRSVAQWPRDAFERMTLLNQYIGDCEKAATDFATKHYKDLLPAEEIEKYRAAVRDPLSSGNFSTALQVFANRHMAITNQRMLEEQVRAKTIELENQKKKLEEEQASNKMKREEWEKERNEIQEKISRLEKRTRLDAESIPAKATAATAVTGTPATANTASVSIDVGASRGTSFSLPPLPGARVVASSGFLQALTPTDLSSATLNEMEKTQMMQPWRMGDGALKDRLKKHLSYLGGQ